MEYLNIARSIKIKKNHHFVSINDGHFLCLQQFACSLFGEQPPRVNFYIKKNHRILHQMEHKLQNDPLVINK